MVKRFCRIAVLAVTLAGWTGASEASAQVFGTFTWRMEPYCNLITLTITQFPGGFTIDGHDSLCGTGKLAAATGQVLLNPDGTVGLHFTIVLPPSGKDVHVAALISPANGSGTWSDGVGNAGTFLLGAPGTGSPRPLPASGLGPATITATEIASAASALIPPGGNGQATANCNAGERVISGGHNTSAFELVAVASFRIGNGWTVLARNNAVFNATIFAQVYCLAQ